MSGFPNPVETSLLIDAPPSGAYITGIGPQTTQLLVNNQILGCHLFVPVNLGIQAFGFNITVAGDGTAVAFIALWQRQQGGPPVYNQVIAEQQLNVAATTGIEQVTFSPVIQLAAGRYIATLRSTAGVTLPTVTAVNATAGGFLYAADSTEATSDSSRGAVGSGQINGYSGTGPIVGTSFSLIAGTRAIGPRLFLKAA